MSGSTETVLEKCPLEAALVASLKLIIYMLDFSALSVGAITKVSPRTLVLSQGLLSVSCTEADITYCLTQWCSFCPFSFSSCLRSLVGMHFYLSILKKNLLPVF